jgi:hypothetical protein
VTTAVTLLMMRSCSYSYCLCAYCPCFYCVLLQLFYHGYCHGSVLHVCL